MLEKMKLSAGMMAWVFLLVVISCEGGSQNTEGGVTAPDDTSADVDSSSGDSDDDLDDMCPNDPDKTEPGMCGCGVPEGTCDTHGDTIEETDSITHDGTDTETDSETEDIARWTFLVFMNGDNDLEKFVTRDLNELEQIGSGDGVHVLVQADRIDGYVSDDGDWTHTRRYYITRDNNTAKVTSEVVDDLGELDMGDPQTLSDFLMWAHENYPAERMALSMWNHGDSWRSSGPPKIQKLISSDDTSGKEINIANGELSDGLERIVAARGALDLIAFDACLMASWEVAHSLQGYALNMAGSETYTYEEGYTYEDALALLRDVEANADGAALADEMARTTVQFGGEYTHTAVDLTALVPLSTAVDDLANLVLSNGDLAAPLLDARSGARGADKEWKNWYLDLADLGAQLAKSDNPKLRASGQAIQDGMDEAVISIYGKAPFAWTGGLTIMFDFEYSDPALKEYADGTWAKETSWDDLLIWLSKN